MHHLSAMLFLWAGVSAAGLAAAVVMVAAEVWTTVEDAQGVDSGKVFLSEAYA